MKSPKLKTLIFSSLFSSFIIGCNSGSPANPSAVVKTQTIESDNTKSATAKSQTNGFDPRDFLKSYLDAVQFTTDGIKWKAPDPLNLSNVLNFFISLIPTKVSIYDKDYYMMQNLNLANEKINKMMKNFKDFEDIYNKDQTIVQKQNFEELKNIISDVGNQINSIKTEGKDIVYSYQEAKSKGMEGGFKTALSTKNLQDIKKSAVNLSSTLVLQPFFDLMRRQIKIEDNLNQNIVNYNQAVITYGVIFAAYLQDVYSIELSALLLKKSYPNDFAKILFSEDLGIDIDASSYDQLKEKLDKIFEARSRNLNHIVVNSLIKESDNVFMANLIGISNLASAKSDFKIKNYVDGKLYYSTDNTDGVLASDRCDDSSSNIFTIDQYSGMVICNMFKTGYQQSQSFNPNPDIDKQMRKGIEYDLNYISPGMAELLDKTITTKCYDYTKDAINSRRTLRYRGLINRSDSLSSKESRYWKWETSWPYNDEISLSKYTTFRTVRCDMNGADGNITSYYYDEVYMPAEATSNMGRFVFGGDMYYKKGGNSLWLYDEAMHSSSHPSVTVPLVLNGVTPTDLFLWKFLFSPNDLVSERMFTRQMLCPQVFYDYLRPADFERLCVWWKTDRNV